MRWLLFLCLVVLSVPAFASSCASYDSAFAAASEQAGGVCSASGLSDCSAPVSGRVNSSDSTGVYGQVGFSFSGNAGVNSPVNSPWQPVASYTCPAGFQLPSNDPAGDECRKQPAQPFVQSGGAMQAGCHAGCGYAFVNGKSGIQVTQAGSGPQVASVMLYPTGATCDASGAITNGSDSSVPTSPSAYPSAPDPAPRVCGGGSCYDPGTGQACAVSGGQQVCVSASAGQSGGCASGGGTTVCAGDPAPVPGKSTVSDPQHQITASDTYNSQSTDGSGLQSSSSTTVNVYNGAGSSSSSGATSSDASSGSSGSGSSGSPAHSGTAADGGSVSGGGDCATPPICSGDAVGCAVVSQTWNARCEAQTVADALDPSKLSSSPEDGNSQAVSVKTQELGGDPDSTGLDDSGWGFANKCPLQAQTITMQGQTVTLDTTKLCTPLGWFAIFVLIGAYIVAARLIMD